MIVRGLQLPVLETGVVTAAMVARFADAQADHNPIHLSHAAALSAGFAGPVLHGMYIMAQFERLLLGWQAMTIIRLQARFVRPVAVGLGLKLSGRVLEAQDGEIFVRLSAKTEGEILVAIGEARLRRSHPEPE